jgi:hypothetical protein
LDVKAVVLPVVVSDSLRDFIEPELLLPCVLSPSSESDLSIAMHLSDSVEWHLRDNVEWSVDIESKFFVESLGFSLCSFVKIKDSPSLVNSIRLFPDSNLLTFLVLS